MESDARDQLWPLRALIRPAEPSFLLLVFKAGFQIIPKRRTAGPDRRSDTSYDAFVADPVFPPALSLVGQVEQYRHGPVRGMGQTASGVPASSNSCHNAMNHARCGSGSIPKVRVTRYCRCWRPVRMAEFAVR